MPEVTIKNGEEKKEWKKNMGDMLELEKDLAPALPGCSQHSASPQGFNHARDQRMHRVHSGF